MSRIIHQTWKNKNIPACYLKEWQQSWKTLHPEWKYKFWTDVDNSNLIKKHYPNFYVAYEQLPKGIIKSDIVRMLYLHRYGGLYVDMDFVCLRSLHNLLSELKDYIVLGSQHNRHQPVPNAWMYSPAGHYFWWALVRDAFRAWRSGENHVESIAGPKRLQWGIKKYKLEHVRLPGKLIYPYAWNNDQAVQFAKTLNWKDLDGLRQAYPDSYAVTKWTHNW